jgi:hypothetical protein
MLLWVEKPAPLGDGVVTPFPARPEPSTFFCAVVIALVTFVY